MTKSEEENDEFRFDKDRVQIDNYFIIFFFLPVAAVALNRRSQRRIPGDRPLIVFIPVDHLIHNYHHAKILILHHMFFSVNEL